MDRNISEIFTRHPISVPPHTCVQECISIMKAHRISCLLVTEDEKPVGIYTERDMVLTLSQRIDLNTVEICELMSAPVIVAGHEISVFEASYILTINHVRHLVITNDEGRTEGVITQTDIITKRGLNYFGGRENIHNLMIKKMLTVTKETPVLTVVEKMDRYNAGCAIVEEDHKPVGILTEKDMASLMLLGAQIEALTMSDVMSTPVKTIPLDITAYEAIKLMNQYRVRRLVVIDENMQTAGILIQDNIIRELEGNYIHFLKRILKARDIGLKKTKAKLLEQSHYLENILRSSIDMAIIATDLDFKITYFNPEAERIFDRSAVAVVSQGLVKTLAIKELSAAKLKQAKKQISKNGEYCFSLTLDVSGENRIISARITDIRDNEGQRFGYTLMSRDITEQRLAEKENEHSIARLNATLDSTTDGILVMNSDGEYTGFNRQFIDLWEVPKALLAHEKSDRAIRYCLKKLQESEAFMGTLGNLAEHPNQESFDILYFKNGRIFECASKPQVLNKVGVGRVWSFRDVTAKRKADEKLLLASRVYESAIEGIMITDADGTIKSVNRAFTTITGYTEQEAVGKNPRMLRSNRHKPAFYKKMWREILSTGRWQGEIWNRRKNRETYPEHLTISSVKNDEGNAIRYVGVFYDITDIKAHEEEIRHLAYHDPLTKLPNRLLFQDRLTQAIARADRKGAKLAVIFLDVDHFKDLNDRLGHYMGDLFLQEVSTQFKNCLRTGDTVSRFGGDEFTILMEEISGVEDASTIAQKTLNLFNKTFRLEGNDVYLSVSIGIAIYPDDGRSPEVLKKNADTAMYHAKAEGRNNYQFFKPEMAVRVKERVTLETDLREALIKDEFRVRYQPITDLNTQSTTELEALVRWKKSGGQVITPGYFIPIAEESGLIVPIGTWVLHQACRQTAAWIEQGMRTLRISVNLSARQFREKHLLDTIERTLEETGLSPESLNLEITESVMMEDMDASIQTLKRFKEIGVCISMDDFGTGYSSFTYLKRFPIDILKLDTTFIRDIVDDPDAAKLAAGMISLAKGLRLQVVAEGVETEQQLAFLKEHGCDKVQGYLFHEPLQEIDVVGALT